MENRSLFIRFLVVCFSLLLFLVAASGLTLMIDTYVSQHDNPTAGSTYDHVKETLTFYKDSF